jgi:hypothetical protein
VAYQKKVKKKLPEGLMDEHFTAAEIDELCHLLFVYASKLSADACFHTKPLRCFNRQGLYELGIHSSDLWVSKLLKYHPHNTIAENIIIAYGYTKTRM